MFSADLLGLAPAQPLAADALALLDDQVWAEWDGLSASTADQGAPQALGAAAAAAAACAAAAAAPAADPELEKRRAQNRAAMQRYRQRQRQRMTEQQQQCEELVRGASSGCGCMIECVARAATASCRTRASTTPAAMREPIQLHPPGVYPLPCHPVGRPA